MPVALAFVFPVVLIFAMLGMERVERPLYADQMSLELEKFFDSAQADELETFVRQGYKPALDRYWRRRHHGVPAHL